MAALAKDRSTRFGASVGKPRLGDVATATTIYKGSIVAKNAGGFLVPASDAANLQVVGIAEETVVNAGANGAKTCSYMTDVEVELENAGGAIVQASKHELCYVADDQSVTTAAVAAQDIPVGQVVSFTATKVWVHISEAISVSV